MIYSLQQLHAKAVELRAKYGFDPKDYGVRSYVEISEVCGKRTLECHITLSTKDHDFWVLAAGVTPETALSEFERLLENRSGKVLDDIVFDVDDILHGETHVPEEKETS